MPYVCRFDHAIVFEDEKPNEVEFYQINQDWIYNRIGPRPQCAFHIL